MRALIAIFLSLTFLSVGCGSKKTDVNNTPLTEEQKRKIAEEDRKTIDEETGGNTINPNARK